LAALPKQEKKQAGLPGAAKVWLQILYCNCEES
jgi:hypothetical protein